MVIPSGSSGSDSHLTVGHGDYEVQPGDCMESIAAASGYLWQTLWNLPENAELKQNRKPNVLLPGDRVTIPPLRLREESCSTEQLHSFRLTVVPSRLQLRFLDEKNQPRSGIGYVLSIDGNISKGTLDGSGALNVPIHPNASQGSITLNTQPEPETYPLSLGFLDPDSAATGIRGRLNNLGFTCAIEGDWDNELQNAVKRFQLANDLQPTGELDDETRQMLTGRHRS